MSNLTDEELTKLAAESLLADAKKFSERHARFSQQREAPKNLNTGFLRRLINNNASHNQRMEVNRALVNSQISSDSSSTLSGPSCNDNNGGIRPKKPFSRRERSSSSSNCNDSYRMGARGMTRSVRKSNSSSSSNCNYDTRRGIRSKKRPMKRSSSSSSSNCNDTNRRCIRGKKRKLRKSTSSSSNENVGRNIRSKKRALSASSSSNSSMKNGRQFKKQLRESSTSSTSSSDSNDSDSFSCHSSSVSISMSSEDESVCRKRLSEDILDGVGPAKRRKRSYSSID